MEVINLTVFDLDQERGTLMVRPARMPIGQPRLASPRRMTTAKRMLDPSIETQSLFTTLAA